MAVDGGKVSIQGFVFQTIAALMDGLAQDSWTEVELEPAGEGMRLPVEYSGGHNTGCRGLFGAG